MRQAVGRLLEIELAGEAIAGRIACPDDLLPAPGQYLLATPLDDPQTALAVPLFATGMSTGDGLIAAPIPRAWSPGTLLALRGPLGRGFKMPASARRVSLAAFGDTPTRLLPLVVQALGRHAAVSLYVDLLPDDPVLRNLPPAVEISPLDNANEAAAWADFLAMDVPLSGLADLPLRIGLEKDRGLGCEAQVLVWTGMPCGGLAECGACVVRTRKVWSLACKDGPVYNLNELSF